MKYILLTIITVNLMTQISLSQVPQANTHIANSYIDKFQGTWRWTSGNDTVIIKLGKVQYFYSSPPQSSEDILLGCHTYVGNGLLVESSMQRYDSVISNYPKRNTLFGWNMDDIDTSKVEGIFKDLSKNKKGAFFLEYISGTTPQIIWKLENTKGLVAVPQGTSFDYNFTLPRNMVLTKQ